jgi:leader peptidase (prepilin peptidase) / N-methyltransferase
MMLERFLDLIIFTYGLCVGSFLNVCIYRLPKRKSIVFPPSHCPNCKARIPWYHNVPVLSYMILRGKCSSCKKSISPCYPVVELITGLFAIFLYHHFRMDFPGHFILLTIFYFIFISLLIVITTIDLRYFIIPDELSIPGIILGIVFSAIVPEMQGKAGHLQGMLHSLIAAVACGGILLTIALVGTWVFRKEAMGMGDIKLVAMFGAFLGIKLVLLSIFVASVIGSIAGVLLIVLQRAKMKTRIPFGPYLSAGAVFSLFYGQKFIELYIAFITKSPCKW